MLSSTLLTLMSIAGGALAACAGASGCCCRDFSDAWKRQDETNLWVKFGTTQAEVDEFLANE